MKGRALGGVKDLDWVKRRFNPEWNKALHRMKEMIFDGWRDNVHWVEVLHWTKGKTFIWCIGECTLGRGKDLHWVEKRALHLMEVSPHLHLWSEWRRRSRGSQGHWQCHLRWREVNHSAGSCRFVSHCGPLLNTRSSPRCWHLVTTAKPSSSIKGKISANSVKSCEKSSIVSVTGKQN